MEEINKTREKFISILKDLLETFPQGVPKNELWNMISRGNRRFTKESLGVRRLSDALQLCPFIEEVTVNQKACVRLQKMAKGNRKKEGKHHQGSGDQPVPEETQNDMLSQNPALSSHDSHQAPPSAGLLAGELLGPALWQPPNVHGNASGFPSLRPHPIPLMAVPTQPMFKTAMGAGPDVLGEWPTLQQGAMEPPGVTKQRMQQQNYMYATGQDQHQRGRQPLIFQNSGDTSRGSGRDRQGQNHHSQRSRVFSPSPSPPQHGHQTSSHQSGLQGRLGKEQLDSYAQICIDQLSEACEYVCTERIEALLLQRLQKKSFRDLQSQEVRSVDHLPSVREHQRTACKVNACVQAFIQVRSICTLHEIEQSLLDYAPDKQNFDSFKLGPLQKQPLIYDMFKFPPDVGTIPKITTMDILQHIREFLTKESKWTEKLEMEPTMNYLVEKYEVPDAYHLGVRIRSLPLAVQMLKKAQRDAGSSRKVVLEKLKEDLQRDLEGAVQRFRASVLQSVTTANGDSSLEIRKHYLETAPELVIMEIFSKFQLLMSLEVPENNRARKRHTKVLSTVTEFLTTIREDEIASKLFHLSVCVGVIELQEMVKDSMMTDTGSADAVGDTTAPQQMKSPPPIARIVEKLQSYLDRCLTHGTVTLQDLQRIEENLLRDFEFPSFHSMGLFSFLGFLLSHREAKALLEENCGITLGSSGTHSNVSFFQPRYTDVLQVVRQAEGCGLTELPQIEDAVCSQFCVKDIRVLGYGMLDRLKRAANKLGKHHSRENLVVFEATLCANNRHFTGSGQIGLLGHQTKESARLCLNNCPLMADIEAWSSWSLVFEAELGSLKEFVQKYGGLKQFQLEGENKMVTTDFVAMETKPGHLIKLVAQTSLEEFEKAVQRGDPRESCGHLVSQIVANKGVAKTSVALLANHVKSALYTMNASSVEPESPGGPPRSAGITQNRATEFVLHCLHCLPIRICCSVANQIFLNPLGEVLGSRHSKIQLLKVAEGNMEYMSRLLQLGCLLGIREWTEQFHTKLGLPAEAVTMATDCGEKDEVEMLPRELEMEDDLELDDSSDESSSSESDPEETDTEEPSSTTNIGETEVSEEQPKVTSVEENSESGETTDTSSSDTTDSEKSETDKCKELIDQIRKEEFGIGVELSEDGQKLMKVQQERLGRSLDRLSKDLYSKDTHFVLELVQNADDNEYPSDTDQSEGFCPAVEFNVDEARVVVSNNECGFEERNIRAICDVGRSTKGKHKFGYIGQKGIGFKSVFRVTDCPEVHSNGFHIKFDVNSGPTGYILPHWMEEESAKIDNKWMTQIILPFKKEAQTRTFAARFNDIHPSLLLFLHRLRRLSVINKVENRVVSMRRRDLDNNVVEIQHNDSTDLWLVVRKVLDASQISLQAKSGVEVESTEIALAFPLKPLGQTSLSQVLPPKQEVFAFLPLHSYGFRFIIQGDFDVPSSREDVDKDSAWNQWLRNEIPTLFIEAFEAFKAHKDFTLMEAICSYLQMVPTEDEILDFFQPVATHILQKLRGKNCIPTHPNSKGEVYMKKPSQVITTRDSLVKEVVNPDMLHKHLNLFYLHGDLAAMLNPSLTITLGIETVTTQHLLQVGKAIALGLLSGGDADYKANILLVAQWMACVYRSMDELQDGEVFSTLKAMNIIPLSEGKFVSLDSTTVFFPLTETTTSERKQKDPFLALQSDLFAVHPDFINTPDNVVNSQVTRLLQELGVKDLSPMEVIGHHIMPVLKSAAWEEKSKELLVCYIVYIKQQMEKNPNIVNFNELRDAVKILTSHGIKNPFADSIHFPPEFGNKISLRDVLPGYDWVFLDPVYLFFADRPSDLQRWREFFTKLGVVDFLSVKQRRVHLTAENMDDSPWSPLKDMWRPLPGGYVISDYCCEEFYKLVTENTHPENVVTQMKSLATLLDQEWDKLYSQYQIASVSNTSGETVFETESSFSIHLHSTSWFPCLLMKPVIKDNVFAGMEEALLISQPFMLYSSVPEIKALLGHTVPYMAVGLAGNSSFGKFLKVRCSVDTKTVLDSLISWAKRENDKEPTVFCTSLQHIKHVYQFLFDRLSPKEAQDLLHEHPVIFVFVEDNVGDEMIKAGYMMKRDDVWWDDPTGLFSKRKESLKEFHADVSCRRTIHGIYADMEECFTGRYGRIQRQPSMTEYAKLWIHIASTEILSRESHTHHDVLRLMAQIGKHLLQGDSDKTSNKLLLEEEKKQLKSLISSQKIFPTKRNLWVSLFQNPMIPDDRQLEQMFEENKDVHFLNLEEAANTRDRRKGRGRIDQGRTEEIKQLLLLCGVASLSSSVDRMDVTELSQPCPVLMMYMHKVVPYLQQYLYIHFPDIYQSLITANMAARLLTMSFMQVGTLEVVYSLRHSPETIVRKKEACTYDFENNTFFFHKEHINKYPDINREIAKCFSENNALCLKDLRGFLAELTSIFQTSGDLQELLDRHELTSVQLEDVPWYVPKPEIHAAPQPVKEEVKDCATESKPEKEGSASNDDELRVWPPRSSVASGEATSTVKKGSTDRQTSNVWPPPKPPSYMETRELPPRFQNLPPMDGVGNDEAKSEEVEELQEKKKRDSAEGEARFGGRRTDGAVSHPTADQRAGQESRANQENPTEHSSLQAGQDRKAASQPRSVSNETRAENSEGQKQMVNDSKPDSSKTEDGVVEPGEATAPPENQSMEPSPTRDGMGRKRFPPDEIATPSPKKPSLQLDPPVWNDQTMSEMTFEELGTGSSLQLPDEMELDATAAEREIGDWGERLVKNYLLQLQQADDSIQYVIWSKETGNEGNPYDFEVTFQSPDGQKSIFIEVKTTLSCDKGTFEISAQELRFALDRKENFHIYRVYGACSKEQIRLVRITNVPWQLDKKRLRLYMVV